MSKGGGTNAHPCTCLRLRKAARRVSQIYDRYLASFGLTVTQYGVLGHVVSFDGISIGALAEKLFMDPTTLTRNLSPLQRLNLVVVKPDRHDRRSRRLHVTPSGRKAFARAKPGWPTTLTRNLSPLQRVQAGGRARARGCARTS